MMAAYALTQTAPSAPFVGGDGAVGRRASGFRIQCAITGSALRFILLTGLLALLALAFIGVLSRLTWLLARGLITVPGVFLGLLLLRLLLLVRLILVGHYKSPDKAERLRWTRHSNWRAQMRRRGAANAADRCPRFQTGKSRPCWKKLPFGTAGRRYCAVARTGKAGSASATLSKASIQDEA